MKSLPSTTGETHFDRASWLALALVVVFILAALGSTLYILTLPTDGWQYPYNTTTPVLSNFAGDWPTPLKAGDQVLSAAGLNHIPSEAFSPHPSAFWKEGATVPYTILRDGQKMNVGVTLHRLNAAGILRSFWNTMQDAPAEWSWGIIAMLLFFLRPRSPAARLIFLAFVPENVVTKLNWAATTISHHFAPAPILFINLLTNVFWGYLFFPAIILLALSFPQPIYPLTRWPRAVPRLLFGLTLILCLITMVLVSDILITIILVGEGVLLFAAFGAALFNIRKLSQKPIARAQAAWVIFGFTLSIIPVLVGYLLGSYGYLDEKSISWFYDYFTTLVLSVCLTVAITRYHLFDIYVIIRRTLQYALLTLLLALVYFGGVVFLQSIFRAVTGLGSSGQTQDIAIVLSTLAIAALFNPLRRRVQRFIDRRFFRGKYDAEKILSSFAATARGEASLEPLTNELLDSVEKTMQPEQLSLWIMPYSNR